MGPRGRRRAPGGAGGRLLEKERRAFDPDAGHPDDFFSTHPAAYQASGGERVRRVPRRRPARRHLRGELLLGLLRRAELPPGRSRRATQTAGVASHTATDPSAAATCAGCHDNASNDLAPDCFNNSLCHGAESRPPLRLAAVPHRDEPRTRPPSAPDATSERRHAGLLQQHPLPRRQGGHPSGWSAGVSTARRPRRPRRLVRLPYCESCHGSGLNGGSAISPASSIPAATAGAPRTPSGWDGGGAVTATNRGTPRSARSATSRTPARPVLQQHPLPRLARRSPRGLVGGESARRDGQGGPRQLVRLLVLRVLPRVRLERRFRQAILPDQFRLPRLERPARQERLGRRRQQTPLDEPGECFGLRAVPPVRIPARPVVSTTPFATGGLTRSISRRFRRG